MTCNNCGASLRMRSEFCPTCGQRIVMTMDDIVTSSHQDAAERRGAEFDGKLRAGIMLMAGLFVLLVGFIYLYDKPLVFDGSAMPSFEANASVANGTGVNLLLEKPYADPRPVPPLAAENLRVLQHRREPIRTKLRTANGGYGKEYDTAINLSLAFLSRQQEKDGGWPVSIIPGQFPQGDTGGFQWGRVGVSSLVLLAYFGDGHSWMHDDPNQRELYGDTTRRGIQYLIAAQDPETGRFGVGEGERVHFMYNHAMATLAMAEATGLSGDAKLRARVAKAVGYLVKTQTDNGGWNYFGHPDSDDISVSTWVVQALVAAREAGVDVPEATLTKAQFLFHKGVKDGRVMYRLQNDDGIFTPSLNGMGLMVRQLLGESASVTDLKVVAAKLSDQMPKVKTEWGHGWNPRAKDAADRAKFDPYMLYYCTYGLFFVGGKEWQEWNTAMLKTMLAMQENDGSWRANDLNTMKGGTCYATALCALTLQVHHRTVYSLKSKGEVKHE